MTEAMVNERFKPEKQKSEYEYKQSLETIVQKVMEEEGYEAKLLFSEYFEHPVKIDLSARKIDINPFLVFKEWDKYSNRQEERSDIENSWRFKFFIAILLKQVFDRKVHINKNELMDDYYQSKYWDEEFYRINIRNIKWIFRKKKQQEYLQSGKLIEMRKK